MKKPIIWIVLAVAIAYFVEFALFPEHKGTSQAHVATRIHACVMSQDFVIKNLKSPSTAQFPDTTEESCQTSQSENVWLVTSYVDSQNSYGAMIRSNYGVQMRYDPTSERWTLLDISITSP